MGGEKTAPDPVGQTVFAEVAVDQQGVVVGGENEQHRLVELSAQNNSLIDQLAEYTRYEALSVDIRPELATLFPQVSRFSLSRVTEVNRDSTDTRVFVAAIIQCAGKSTLSETEKEKLHDWLKARINADSLVVVRGE